MRVLAVDADALTKLVLQKIIDELQTEDISFLQSDEVSFEAQCHLKKPNVVFYCLRKGRRISMTVLRRFTKSLPANCQTLVIAEPHHQKFLQELAETEKFHCLSKPLSKKKIIRLMTAGETKVSLEGNAFLEEFRGLVLSKDFKKVYQQIGTLQEQISEKYLEEPEVTIAYIDQMIDAALEMINCTNQAQKIQYREKFGFSKQTLQDKFRIQFMLYQVLKLVYQQRAIQKYPQLNRLFDYLDKNLYDELSLAEAAEHCEISQSYLSRLLKDCYSLGFNSYAQIEKVYLAKKAFYYNDDKIIDVSFQLSYSEPSYFCKVFKRVEGQTPTCVKAEMDKIRQMVIG